MKRCAPSSPNGTGCPTRWCCPPPAPRPGRPSRARRRRTWRRPFWRPSANRSTCSPTRRCAPGCCAPPPSTTSWSWSSTTSRATAGPWGRSPATWATPTAPASPAGRPHPRPAPRSSTPTTPSGSTSSSRRTATSSGGSSTTGAVRSRACPNCSNCPSTGPGPPSRTPGEPWSPSTCRPPCTGASSTWPAPPAAPSSWCSGRPWPHCCGSTARATTSPSERRSPDAPTRPWRTWSASSSTRSSCAPTCPATRPSANCCTASGSST